MYLTHLSIQQIISQSFTYTFTYTHFIAVLYFFSELIITIVVSGVISVVIEHPWLNVEKLLVQWTVGGCQSKAKKEVDESKNIPEKNEITKCWWLSLLTEFIHFSDYWDKQIHCNFISIE